MRASPLLKLTAIAEAPVGLALLAMPGFLVRILLGVEISFPFEFTIARIAGSAILVLGVVSWMSRDFPLQHLRPLVIGLLVYNVCVTILLLQSAIENRVTAFLSIAVVAHVLLGVLCSLNLKGVAYEN